jgi:hypothetical protein
MIELFGKKYEAPVLHKYVGNLSQVFGTRPYELTEGSARGTRAIDVHTGSGLNFTVLPDRGMDISLASYRGINLVYLTPNGEVNPAFYDPAGSEWLKVFIGGLLTTCGLTHIGPPGEDGGEALGLHGRHTATPARKVCDLSGMDGDRYVLRLTGTVEDSTLFGDKLVLKREIAAYAGAKSLVIRDEAENNGFRPSPFTILYHINFGFPLLAPGVRIFIGSDRVEAYDEHSLKNMNQIYAFPAPDAGFMEQNYLHRMIPDENGYGYAALINEELLGGIGVYMKFGTGALPFLSQWKMAGETDYVLALEPCNTKCENRRVLREAGMLPMLMPGEKKCMEIEIGVLEGKDEITGFLEKHEKGKLTIK